MITVRGVASSGSKTVKPYGREMRVGSAAALTDLERVSLVSRRPARLAAMGNGKTVPRCSEDSHRQGDVSLKRLHYRER